jgi:hypothetical protein
VSFKIEKGQLCVSSIFSTFGISSARLTPELLGYCWNQWFGEEHDTQADGSVVRSNRRHDTGERSGYQNVQTRRSAREHGNFISRLYSLSVNRELFPRKLNGRLTHVCSGEQQVKDNIALGDPHNAHDENRVREAARLGGAEEFIDKMSEGFNTYLSRPVQDYWSVPSNVRTKSGAKLDLDLFREAIGRVGNEDSVKLSGGQMQRLAV